MGRVIDVTIISCLYGDSFEKFARRWWRAIRALDPCPAHVILSTEADHGPSLWTHPEPWYLNIAWRLAHTEWVWVVNLDDLVLPDALVGLEECDADVWLTGFERDDGVIHISEPMSNDAYLASSSNGYAAGSAIRRSALERVGGFRDAGFQDWDLWRRLAAAGATFATSGRVNYLYSQHDQTRTNLELTPENRERHLAEMAV
jgi:hypothetical protein